MLNGLPFSYIGYTKLHCYIISGKKCTHRDSNQGPLHYRGQSFNHFTHGNITANFCQKILFITILYCRGCWHSMRSRYAESHVVARVQKPHAMQLLTTAEVPTPGSSSLLYATPGSIWPPNSLFSKFRRLCH